VEGGELEGFPALPGYEIIAELGRGGMGVVYQARQARLDRLVAIKILPAEACRDPHFVERFSREARALARLNHPNIITIHDFGEQADQYYLVMEFVAGSNLRQRLRAGKMAPADVFRVVASICDALEYAHEEGIVHRDIKPENILLDRKDRVKIADFGIAKLLTHKTAQFTLTGPSRVVGTWHYMAPEQLNDPAALDQRADIYSLGVMFYEMLTGKLPQGRFPPPSEVAAVQGRVDELVLRALEREPERRFQTAGDLRTALDAAASALPEVHQRTGALGIPSAGWMPTIADAGARPGGPVLPEKTSPVPAMAPIAPGIPDTVRKRVRRAAMALLICGILGLLSPVGMGLTILLTSEGLFRDPAPLFKALAAICFFALPAAGALWVWTALRMMKLRSYRLVMGGTFLAMVPWSPLWIVSWWVGLHCLEVLLKLKVRKAFAEQKAWDAAHPHLLGPGPVRRFLSNAAGWMIVCCVASIILCLQPLLPWSELQVIDAKEQVHELAAAYGYQSVFAIIPAVLCFALVLVHIATGFIEPVPLWQPLVRIVAGMVILVFVGANLDPRTPESFRGKENIEGLGKTTVTAAILVDQVRTVEIQARWAGGAEFQADYEVSGRPTSVRLRRENVALLQNVLRPLRVRIQAVVYLVAVLGLIVLVLSTMQLRCLLMRRRDLSASAAT
jgi:predicted Ser/Thr protein kinase